MIRAILSSNLRNPNFAVAVIVVVVLPAVVVAVFYAEVVLRNISES